MTGHRFEDASAHVLSCVRAGASIDEAARQAGVPVPTVRRWLNDGRKAPDGRYGAWTAEVDAVRRDRANAEDGLDGPLTDDEADELLARAARQGSIAALKLFYARRDVQRGRQDGESARAALSRVFGEQ
jgi:hypothetical protein